MRFSVFFSLLLLQTLLLPIFAETVATPPARAGTGLDPYQIQIFQNFAEFQKLHIAANA